jgi:hypothetical protein
MNSTMTIDQFNLTADASAQGAPVTAKRVNPVKSSPWRTLAIAVLLTVAICLVVRVVLAVNQLDAAQDALVDGIKYLKVNTHLTNF